MKLICSAGKRNACIEGAMCYHLVPHERTPPCKEITGVCPACVAVWSKTGKRQLTKAWERVFLNK